MSYDDIECPYCGSSFEYDSSEGPHGDDETGETECPKCGAEFNVVASVEITHREVDPQSEMRWLEKDIERSIKDYVRECTNSPRDKDGEAWYLHMTINNLRTDIRNFVELKEREEYNQQKLQEYRQYG